MGLENSINSGGAYGPWFEFNQHLDRKIDCPRIGCENYDVCNFGLEYSVCPLFCTLEGDIVEGDLRNDS